MSSEQYKRQQIKYFACLAIIVYIALLGLDAFILHYVPPKPDKNESLYISRFAVNTSFTCNGTNFIVSFPQRMERFNPVSDLGKFFRVILAFFGMLTDRSMISFARIEDSISFFDTISLEYMFVLQAFTFVYHIGMYLVIGTVFTFTVFEENQLNKYQ